MEVMTPRIFDLRQRDVPLGVILRWEFHRFGAEFTDEFEEDDFGELLLPKVYATPSNSKLYLFRRIGSPITQQEIDDYFAAGAGDTNPEEIWRIKSDIHGIFPRKWFDQRQINYEITVYYTLIIRNEDTGDYSAMFSNKITIS